MNLKHCKRNTVAYVPEFEFRHGDTTAPKFFIILTNPTESSNTVIVATFTRNLKYKNKKFTIFIPKESFEDSANKKFTYEDSLIDCNTCYEFSLTYLRNPKCKYITEAGKSTVSQIHEALPYATRVDAFVMVRLKEEMSE